MLKKCPHCSRRFEVERRAEADTTQEETVTVEEPSQSMTQQTPSRFVTGALDPLALPRPPEQKTMLAEKDVHTRTFVCKNCGYTWSEETVRYRDEKGRALNADDVVTEGAP